MLSKEDTDQPHIGTEQSGSDLSDTSGQNCPAINNSNFPKEGSGLLDKIVSGHDNRYRILELIGRGGSGDVYKARIEIEEKESSWAQTQGSNTTRIVACKILLERLLDNKQHYKRFQHEAKLAKRLIHPNIVNVHDAGEIDGRPFIILDYLEGNSLSGICDQSRISVHRALPIFLQISKAFAYAHLNSIVHRDLKPGNIMLTRSKDREDFVKVVDFGIAKIITETTMGSTKLTKTGEIFGSPLYMSPEQCRGEVLDVRSDIYSFGILMYEVLTGSTPFKGMDTVSTMFKHTTEAPKSIGKIDEDMLLAKKLEKIIFKCLEKDPNSRYQTMDAVTRDLEAIQLHLEQLKSGQTNKVLESGQRAWLFFSQFIRKICEHLFSRQLSSSGLTIGSVLLIASFVLMLTGACGWIFLFGSTSNNSIVDRELNFIPIVDTATAIKISDQKLADSVWTELEIPSAAVRPPLLEKALSLFIKLGDLNKKVGNYEIASWWYLRSEIVIEWLEQHVSITAISINNRYAESCLLINTRMPPLNQLQNEQRELLLKQYGKFITPKVLREKGLISVTNAATARDSALKALTGVRDLAREEEHNSNLAAQTLLAQGLLAESFLGLGDIKVAKIGFDQFYETLKNNDSIAKLDVSQRMFILASGGRFFLQQREFDKANDLLNRLPPELNELGSTAKYELAVIYNDLGLIKESIGQAREAENFFSQSSEYLAMCAGIDNKSIGKVANNIAIAAFKDGDFKTALQSKLQGLAKLSI